MNWRAFRSWILPAVGAVLIIVAVVLINQNATIQYPLGTWRIDLDDALVGIGTILIGAAAIWQVWIKAKEADRKAEAVDKKLNGGLSSLAAQIMADELRMAGFETGLSKRVEFLEDHYQDCLEREIVWQKEQKQIMEDRKLLRDLMNERLGDEA